MLDDALLRPGRFDYRPEVPKPDQEGREAVLAVHLRGKPVAAGGGDRHPRRADSGNVGSRGPIHVRPRRNERAAPGAHDLGHRSGGGRADTPAFPQADFNSAFFKP